MKKLVFIQSNPIQYFAPLYKYLSENGLDVEVWYCSESGVKEYADKGFGVNVKWNIPLLSGYKYKFYRNQSPNLFKGTFFEYLNIGIIRDLFKEKNAVFVIPGWQFFTYVLTDIIGSLGGREMSLRFETPLSQMKTGGIKSKLKTLFLRWYLGLNKFIFYIGLQNRAFIQHYIGDNRELIFSPYSVDNERFDKEFESKFGDKIKFRAELGIPPNAKVILYSGKYVSKKRPIDLLKAFIRIDDIDTWLIFMGEGELRCEMEEFIRKENVQRTILTGFVNQDKISEYYIVSDVFVMCSGDGETWGLSVNEAMNFELPIIVYDRVGCSSDLVQDGVNGFIIPFSDIDKLYEGIKLLLYNDSLRESSGRKSKEIIRQYSFQSILEGFKKVV